MKRMKTEFLSKLVSFLPPGENVTNTDLAEKFKILKNSNEKHAQPSRYLKTSRHDEEGRDHTPSQNRLPLTERTLKVQKHLDRVPQIPSVVPSIPQ